MDPLNLIVSKLPVFYNNLFKIWSLFDLQRNETTPSLHWLLEDPLINGARFHLTKDSSSFHGLKVLLLNSQIFTFGRLIRVAGIDFEKTEEVASCLKVRFLRTVEQMLKNWKSLVSDEEKSLLMDRHGRVNIPSSEDCFPFFTLLPKLEGCKGPFLDAEKPLCLDLFTATGRAFYKICVKVFNKKVLNEKVDTSWRKVLGVEENVKPEWRSLYKPLCYPKGQAIYSGDCFTVPLQSTLLFQFLIMKSVLIVPSVQKEKLFFMLLWNVTD